MNEDSYAIRTNKRGEVVAKPRESPLPAPMAPLSNPQSAVSATLRIVLGLREYFKDAYNFRIEDPRNLNPHNLAPACTHLYYLFTPWEDHYNIRIGKTAFSLHILVTIPSGMAWEDHEYLYSRFDNIPGVCDFYNIRRLTIIHNECLVRSVNYIRVWFLIPLTGYRRWGVEIPRRRDPRRCLFWIHVDRDRIHRIHSPEFQPRSSPAISNSYHHYFCMRGCVHCCPKALIA